MNLVFGAEGLTVGEGAFLMACCNHTDHHGYVVASMQQLADEAHMKERTARENKQRLIKANLLKTAERYHPKTGARIADLYRVNIALLKKMQRKRDYGPSIIEELTFDTPGENPSSDPPADSAAPPADSAAPPAESAGGVGAESAPLLPPSTSPSSLSGVAAASAAPLDAEGPEEREMGAARRDNQARDEAGPESGPVTVVPQQREAEQAAPSDAAVAFVVGLPGSVGRRSAPLLAAQVDEALAEGWTLDALGTYLRARVDVSRAHSPASLYRSHLDDRPEPPARREDDRPAAAACPAGECDGSGLAYAPDDVLQENPRRCACRTTRAAAAVG